MHGDVIEQAEVLAEKYGAVQREAPTTPMGAGVPRVFLTAEGCCRDRASNPDGMSIFAWAAAI